MPFQPGESGNPGGRPKVANEVRELARAHTVDAIKKLAKIMNSKASSDRDALAAANALLDRGYGKPAQDVSVTTRPLVEMTDAEILAQLSDVLAVRKLDDDVDKLVVN